MFKSWHNWLTGKSFPAAAGSRRPGKKRRNRGQSVRPSGIRPRVEELETRVLPAGTWTAFTNPGNTGGLGTMMLLSNGSILAQGAGVSSDWFELTPGPSGNYASSGSWSFLGPMNTPRQFFASNVLPDGRVLVLGGEFSGSAGKENFTNTGEIFSNNQWSPITNFPLAQFGDDPTMVLDDGTVLCGYISGPQTILYNPAADPLLNPSLPATSTPWIQVAPRIHADERGDEETWLKLADGSVLSYDLWNDVSSAHASTAERYIPAIGAWIPAGTVPVDLSDSNFEMGGATLLPDGRAWFVGDNGHTAFYTPPSTLFGTGSWTAGPDLPNGQVADDAPLCQLANGHVLLALDGPGKVYSPPTHIYDFNPFVDFTTTNPFTQVDPPGVDLSHVKANSCRMLALPDGTACLEVNGSGQLFAYKPDSGPNPAWAPSISGITSTGTTFTLSGTQLNGMSAGASYGDDAEMDSNYPIVEYIDTHGNFHYAQSFNWSSTDVQTGSTMVSTNYTLPAGVPAGAYLVQVVASSIASKPVLNVLMDSTMNNITLEADPFEVDVYDVFAGNTLLRKWFLSSFSAVDVTMEGTGGTVNILSEPAGTPVNVYGGGSSTINIGNNVSGVQEIQGPIDLENPSGQNTITIDDSGDSTARTATLSTVTDTTIVNGASGPSGQLSGLAPATITWKYANTGQVTIRGGSGGDNWEVQGTGVGTSIVAGGNDFVNVGDGGSLAGLVGALNIEGPSNQTNINLDDSTDKTTQTYTLTANTVTTGGGFALTYSGLQSLTVNGGSGTNTWVISATPTAPMATLNGGSGNDTFRFTGSGSIPGTINGGGGTTNVLDYSALAGPVSVNLQTGAGSHINGGAAGGFSNITSFIGSAAATDTLIGPNLNITWTISGPNSGTLATFAFSGFENLVGGSGVDTFRFVSIRFLGIVVSGSLAGTLDGGGAPPHQGNWLDYSALIKTVAVNLQAGTATGVAGTVRNIQDVHGGNLRNTLIGDSQGNILIGGAGADTITGGSGPSLLIGDAGADQVTGGSGGDILIGGSTTFDAMSPANQRALMSILAEWQSSDSYATRFADIDTGTGGGLNGTAKLNFGTTVQADAAANTLTASPSSQALDWFFKGTGDTLLNVEAGEHINNNTPAAFKDRTITSPIDEGSLATLSGTITDPDLKDTFMLQVNWGDATAPQTYLFPAGSNGQRVSVTHLYADHGNYSISLFWTDPTGPGNSATMSIVVNDVPPTVLAGGDVTIQLGQMFQRQGSFTDPGANTWKATVDYGDGHGPQHLALNGYDFQLHHHYKATGTYQVVVTVHDDDGGVGTASFVVTVV
jgi:hypothetical protein